MFSPSMQQTVQILRRQTSPISFGVFGVGMTIGANPPPNERFTVHGFASTYGTSIDDMASHQQRPAPELSLFATKFHGEDSPGRYIRTGLVEERHELLDFMVSTPSAPEPPGLGPLLKADVVSTESGL